MPCNSCEDNYLKRLTSTYYDSIFIMKIFIFIFQIGENNTEHTILLINSKKKIVYEF